ncbi:MAG: hypothetical protein JXM70_27335 [Pirellulales bacterium]|nr:hypothetical protein [Pirellulales bacterium]
MKVSSKAVVMRLPAIILTGLALFWATGIMPAADISTCSKYLLLDSRVVEKADGVALRLGQVEKDRRNPLFAEDKPWEVRFDNMYPNVMFDGEDGIYKCWYSPFIIDKTTSTATEEIKKQMTYCKALKHQREMALCYATSKDGIVWDKPELGICDFDGSKQNNIVKRNVHGAGVFKDPHESNPQRRYKMFLERGGMSVCFSPDGLHWSDVIPCAKIKAAGDCHNNAFWDEKTKRYVGITRLWAGPRVVGRTESRDFTDWSQAKVVFRGLEPHLQIYTMPVFRYGDVYLGLPMIFNTKTDQVDCELAWSPDTIDWERICAGRPFIPRGQKGSYDSGCIYAAAYPILHEGKIRIYYGGNDAEHCNWRKGYLCLARMRVDGFAGMDPLKLDKPGTIVTRPIRCTGEQLRVSVDADGGSLRVAVLDADGLSLEKCRPITADVTDGVVRWDGVTDLGSLRGKDIRLKFELKNAKLYAFTFDGS